MDIDIDMIRNLLGDTFSTEFARTCFLFSLAAFVHSRQVRKEIRAQFGELVSVLRQDLEAQKNITGLLNDRVAKIEDRLQLREDK